MTDQQSTTLCECGCGQPTRIRIGRPKNRFILKHSSHASLKYEKVKKDRVLVYQPEHPCADRCGYIFRARLVGEGLIGRPLLSTEDAHHVNRIKDDDRPENIQVLTHSEHMRLHGREDKPVPPLHCGEQQHCAKLTESAVVEIRRLNGSVSAVAVGDRFGVGAQNVRLIWRRKSWRHIL